MKNNLYNNNFRKAIDLAGITPAQAAKRLGYKHYQAYHSVENGIKGISIDKLIILSTITNCSTDYLLGLTNDPTPPKKQNDITLSKSTYTLRGGKHYNIMTDEQKHQFEKMMQRVSNTLSSTFEDILNTK